MKTTELAKPEKPLSSCVGRRTWLLAAAAASVVLLAQTMPCRADDGDTPASDKVATPPSGSGDVMGVSGELVSRAGQPLSGVLVTAHAVGHTQAAIPELAVITTAEGKFHWPLRPGDYELDFIALGKQIARENVSVPASGHVHLRVTAP